MDTATNETQRKYEAHKGYSLKDAAEALTICKRTLTNQIKAGKIRAVPVSARRRVVPGSEIIRILEGKAA